MHSLINIQYDNDADVGVAVIDRFTHLVLSYLEGINKTSQVTMQQLVRFIQPLYHCILIFWLSSSMPTISTTFNPIRASEPIYFGATLPKYC